MKGAKAEPFVKIIKVPNSRRKIIMGVSHHFLRDLKKLHKSFIKFINL